MLDDDLAKLREIPDPLSGVNAEPPAGVRLPAARPTRSDVARSRRLALAVGSAWLVAQLLITGVRPDVAAVPFGYWLALGAVPLAAGVICMVAAVSGGRLGLGQRVALLTALSLIAPAAYAVCGYVLSPPYPSAPLASFEHGVFCLNIALAWTALPLIAAGVALRRSFAGQVVLRSAAFGAGAGLIVSVTSTLRCPLSGALHVALSHGGAVVLTALLGALVLSRVTRA
jgi:hypothetical protein